MLEEDRREALEQHVFSLICLGQWLADRNGRPVDAPLSCLHGLLCQRIFAADCAPLWILPQIAASLELPLYGYKEKMVLLTRWPGRTLLERFCHTEGIEIQAVLKNCSSWDVEQGRAFWKQAQRLF